MSIFSKNNKKKIALALACASVLSGKSSLAAQNTGKVGGAIASSKKMSNLTKSLITGVSVFGAGLIGYEILGDTVFGKAPTLLKWIRGKNISKTPEHINYKNSISKMDIPYRREDVPYRGHRYFPLDFNKNPNGIGLSEKQKKIEKILNVV